MAEPIYEELELARVEWWQWEVLGWPESSSASTMEAAGARVSSGLRLQRPWRCGVGTYGVYAVQQVRWTQALDQMVTGAATAGSSGSGVGRHKRRSGYNDQTANVYYTTFFL